MLFNTLTDVRLRRGQDGKLNQVFDVIYLTLKTLFDRISKLPRRELKIRRAAEYF